MCFLAVVKGRVTIVLGRLSFRGATGPLPSGLGGWRLTKTGGNLSV